MTAPSKNIRVENVGISCADQTHDYDQSDSAGSFTPLPSIQNDYALEIKSFNNQWRKPYSQQLSTNFFRDQFDLIMDNLCDQGATFIEDEINMERLNTLDVCHQSKPLKSFEKVKILFDIIRQARSPDKLQDAKDIFDFI